MRFFLFTIFQIFCFFLFARNLLEFFEYRTLFNNRSEDESKMKSRNQFSVDFSLLETKSFKARMKEAVKRSKTELLDKKKSKTRF